jgi:hypothetical protein
MNVRRVDILKMTNRKRFIFLQTTIMENIVIKQS